jgi:hypothetical protein
MSRLFLLFSKNRSKSLFLQNKSDDVKGLVRTLTMADAVQLSAHTVAVRFGFLWYFVLVFCGIWLLLFASCIIHLVQQANTRRMAMTVSRCLI